VPDTADQIQNMTNILLGAKGVSETERAVNKPVEDSLFSKLGE
jgi:hypothetical protein